MNSKEGAREEAQRIRSGMVEVSHRIHACPELGFEEKFASGLLCDVLSDAGFDVRRDICGMPTAFLAKLGSGPTKIGICAEYDALPGIGHACGHNMIAAMSTGAALAAAKVADEAGLTITVYGTPAEEVGNASGKVLMVEQGLFDGLDLAMMVHPAPLDMVEMSIIAASMFDVHYHGKEAHASAFPQHGVNAADALLLAQTAIGLLRQHMYPTDRVHGITTKGGDAPNVIPSHTSARYLIRGNTLKELEELRPKVLRCFDAGAVATGSRLEVVGGDKPYADMRFNHEMGDLYRANAEALGRIFPTDNPLKGVAASTDMGNVSYKVPSIHPMIGINSLPAGNHQPEFTAHCVRAEADQAVFDGMLAMAWTAIDVASSATLRRSQ